MGKLRGRFVSAALALAFGLGLTLEARGDATADLVKVVKQALASAEPTTAMLRGLAQLPDFEMNGATVTKALREAGAPPTGQVAQVLASVTRLSKAGGNVTIDRGVEDTVPIVVAGKTKGFVHLSKQIFFSLDANGSTVTLDAFRGVQVGEKADDLHDLWTIAWKPGEKESTLTLTAGWLVFSRTQSFKIPNGPAPAPAAPPHAAAPPSATKGVTGALGGD